MAKKNKSKSGGIPPWLLILGGLGVAGYFWLRSQLRFITFGGAGVPFSQINGGNINLGITVPVVNASALSANITGFAGYIVAPGGALLGTVFLKEPVHVARYQQSNLNFTAVIRLTDLAFEAGGIVLGGNIPTTLPEIQKMLKGYTLKGQLRVYGLPLPIETPLV